jgi:hypothetical protein
MAAAPRAAALLLVLVLAAQPLALCQVTSTVSLNGSVPSGGASSPTSAVTMGVNLGAAPRCTRGPPRARALGAPSGSARGSEERACLFKALCAYRG